MKKKTRVVKILRTLREAEKVQNKLYDTYGYVRLVKSPLFTAHGTYIWEVSGEK